MEDHHVVLATDAASPRQEALYGVEGVGLRRPTGEERMVAHRHPVGELRPGRARAAHTEDAEGERENEPGEMPHPRSV